MCFGQDATRKKRRRAPRANWTNGQSWAEQAIERRHIRSRAEESCISRSIYDFKERRRDKLFRQIDRSYPLLVLTRGELLYVFTLSSEGSIIAAHRFNGVVVRRRRHKIYHIHAVNHVREILIPPVKRFCRAIEVLGVGAVVHQRVLN